MPLAGDAHPMARHHRCETSGCSQAHEIICGDMPMKPKRAVGAKAKPRAKAAANAKQK